MSWFLMNQKSKDQRQLKEAKKWFTRADKNGDGEITKEDWFEVLTKAGYSISM